MDGSSESIIYYGIFIALTFDAVLVIYLHFRQILATKRNTQIPQEFEEVLDDSTLEAIRSFTLKNMKIRILEKLFSFITATAFVYFNLIYELWDLSESLYSTVNTESSVIEVLANILFAFLISLLAFTILKMPSLIYETLIEKKGFHIRNLITDFSKPQFIYFSPIVGLIVLLEQRIGYYTFPVVLLISMFVINSTILCKPKKYVKLPPSNLKTSVEELARSVNFPVTRLYMEKSLFIGGISVGISSWAQIVLRTNHITQNGQDFDSLHDEDQILGVIAHELGHWKLNHAIWTSVIYTTQFLLTFTVFALLLNYAPLYAALGFPEGVLPKAPGFVVDIQIAIIMNNVLFKFLKNGIHQLKEYEADAFACKIGLGQQLKINFLLSQKNKLAIPVNDWLYESWHRSHPSILKRISKINNILENQEEEV